MVAGSGLWKVSYICVLISHEDLTFLQIIVVSCPTTMSQSIAMRTHPRLL
jgi:hypothetical protein